MRFGSHFVLMTVIFSLGGGVSSRPAVAEPFAFEKLLSRIQLKNDDLFYGTATAFDFDDDSVYFLATAHTVPNSIENLTVTTQFGLGIPEHVYLVGRDDGRDLAVFAKKKLPQDDIELLELGRDWLQSAARINSSRKLVRAVVVGHKGPHGPIVPRGFKETWAETAAHYSSNIILELYDRHVAPTWMSSPFVPEYTTQCPQIFLSECVLIPFFMRGFSGGLVAAMDLADAERQNEGPDQLLGVVSHYQPFSSQAILIPWSEVLRSTKKLLLDFKLGGSPVLVTTHSHLPIKLMGPQLISLGRGDGAEVQFESTSIAVGGGGAVGVGGGGNDSITSKNRIDFHSGGYGYALLNTNKLEEEIKTPESWSKGATEMPLLFHSVESMRGASAVLGRLDGGITVIENGQRRKVFKFGDVFTDSLRDVVSAFSFTENPLISYEKDRLDLPSNLSVSFLDRNQFGVFGYALCKRNFSNTNPRLWPTPLENLNLEPFRSSPIEYGVRGIRGMAVHASNDSVEFSFSPDRQGIYGIDAVPERIIIKSPLVQTASNSKTFTGRMVISGSDTENHGFVYLRKIDNLNQFELSIGIATYTSEGADYSPTEPAVFLRSFYVSGLRASQEGN